MPLLSLVEAKAAIASLWLYRDVANWKESVELGKLQQQQEQVRLLEVQLQAAKALVDRTQHQVSYWREESDRTAAQIKHIQDKVCEECGCPRGLQGGHSCHGAECVPLSGPPTWGRSALAQATQEEMLDEIGDISGAGGSQPSQLP